MTTWIKTLALGFGLIVLLPGLGGPARAQETPSDTRPQGPATAGSEKSAPLTTLAALSKEGFEAKATAFVPTDAATRQVGHSTADAIVLTLQRGSTIAVCYYTLSAYVNDELPTIESCLVHK